MPIGILWWMLVILWALFGFGVIATSWAPLGGSALLFVLLLLLGWKTFGPPLQ